MYCDLWSEYIQVWKLLKRGNYSRAETKVNSGNYLRKYCNLIMLTTLFYETAMMSMQRKLIQARLVSVRVDLVEIRFGHDLMFYSKAEFLQLSLQQLSA